MTRQQLIDGIMDLDPSFAQFVSWDKYDDDQLQMCYDRKRFAPASVRERMKNYGRNTFDTARRPATSESDIPVTREPKQESVTLTGFDALKKE